MSIRWFTIALLIAALWTSDAAARKWVDASGRHTLEAELVEFKDGVATLKKPDGKTVTLELAKLSSSDQAFLKRHTAALATSATGAESPRHADATTPLGRAAREFGAAGGATPAERGRHLTAARAALDEMRQGLARLPRLRAKIESAMIDFYVAMTYPGGGAERTGALKRAAMEFDAIYQANRLDPQGQVSIIGLYVHTWHGMAKEALGSWQDAVDIYDEVLASAPESDEVGSTPKALSALFAEVEHFKLALLAGRKPREAADEAKSWLAAYRPWKETGGYRAIEARFAGRRAAANTTAEMQVGSPEIESSFATAAAIVGNQ
jgi:hypothetical protein